MLKRLLSECFGTFALVFAGTGAIVINAQSGGAISHAVLGALLAIAGCCGHPASAR